MSGDLFGLTARVNQHALAHGAEAISVNALSAVVVALAIDASLRTRFYATLGDMVARVEAELTACLPPTSVVVAPHRRTAAPRIRRRR